MTLIQKKPKKRTPQSKVVSVDSGLVKDILARNGYTITRAAKVLDMSPTYLSQRLKMVASDYRSLRLLKTGQV